MLTALVSFPVLRVVCAVAIGTVCGVPLAAACPSLSEPRDAGLRLVGKPRIGADQLRGATQFRVYFRTSVALPRNPRTGSVLAQVRLERRFDGFAPIGTVDAARHCYVVEPQFDLETNSRALRAATVGTRLRVTLAVPSKLARPLLTYSRIERESEAQSLRDLGCRVT